MSGIQELTSTLKPKSSSGKRLLKPGQKQQELDGGKEKNPLQKVRQWRRLTRKERMILLLPVAAAIIAVVVVNLFFREKVMTYTLEGSPCQYYQGSIYRMREGTTFIRDQKGKTKIKDSSGQSDANDLPVYYEDRDMVTITQDMVYYSPRTGDYGRLGYFSEIHQLSDNRVSVTREGEELDLEPGFLYNGEDLYLFLEPVILSFNGYQMKLSALSYVEAVYTGEIMVFNYAGKEFLIEAPKGPVTARIETGDYEISLLNDSMTTYSGKRTLLFSRPELLDLVG